MEKLVNGLIAKGVLRTENIVAAFRAVDRKNFVVPAYENEAYIDAALPIGYGQTISQPYTVAFMLELLRPQKGENVLDVGSGSGWTTALLAHIVGHKGSVHGVELVPELVAFGTKNLAKYSFKHASIEKAGEQLGKPENAPYDKILVSAGDREMPRELIDQLKEGGVLVVPIRDAIWKVIKLSGEKTEIEKHESFVFVPLIH